MGKRSHDPSVNLDRSHWDCVVVGGGITGSGIIRELAMRGIKCALFEKGDFASGTSSKTGKLVHGGLRYLKYLHIKTVFESCRERFNLYSILAPEVVTPIRFVLPFYRSSKTPKWLAMIGLFIYDLMSSFRKIGRFGVANEQDLAGLGHRFKRDEFTGALTYYDCFCVDFKLVLAVLKSAFRAGATVVNYMEVRNVSKDENNRWQIDLYDSLTEKDFSLTADNVIYACGAWSEKALSHTVLKNDIKLKGTMGIHILIPQRCLGLRQTIAVEHPVDARPLYMVPWGNMVLVGTTDHYCDQELDNLQISQKQIDYLLKAVNHYFDDQYLSKKDVVSGYIGVRPLMGSDEGTKEEKVSRDYKIVSTKDGLYAIVGGKLTTFRLMSELLVEKVFRERYPGRVFKKDLSLTRLMEHGADANISMADMIKTEWVEKVEDIIFRRTSLYLENGINLRAMIPELAKTWGAVLGKSQDEIAAEICNAQMQVVQASKAFGTIE